MSLETIKVKAGNERGYKIINRSDFQQGVDTPYEKEDEPAQLSDAEQEAADKLAAERKANANYGQVDGGILADSNRNSDGTFSEPTPTDIRYTNKDNTEFANNHGAFVNRSAAEMRAEAGMEDVPGGLNPEEKEFHDAQEAAAKLEAKRRQDGEIGNEFELRREDKTLDNDPARRPAPKPEDNLNGMSIADLKSYAEARKIDLAGHTKRSDIIEAIRTAEAKGTAETPAPDDETT